MKIEFFAPGEPKPQGSKNQFGQESCKLLPAWRSLVSLAAKQAMKGNAPTLNPVSVTASFSFSRPKSHFGTGSKAMVLRSDAPHKKAGKPDLDKLQRAIFDAMTGIVFKDDCQVWSVEAVKIYSDKPGVAVSVQVIE